MKCAKPRRTSEPLREAAQGLDAFGLISAAKRFRVTPQSFEPKLSVPGSVGRHQPAYLKIHVLPTSFRLARCIAPSTCGAARVTPIPTAHGKFMIALPCRKPAAI